MQFEYDVTMSDLVVLDSYSLQKRGREGWELCGVVQDGMTYAFYWKRKVPDLHVTQDDDKGPTGHAYLRAEDFMPPNTFHDSTARDWDQTIPVKDGLETV
jgi:hypothetical protein